jgi:hypothetical protein
MAFNAGRLLPISILIAWLILSRLFYRVDRKWADSNEVLEELKVCKELQPPENQEIFSFCQGGLGYTARIKRRACRLSLWRKRSESPLQMYLVNIIVSVSNRNISTLPPALPPVRLRSDRKAMRVPSGLCPGSALFICLFVCRSFSCPSFGSYGLVRVWWKRKSHFVPSTSIKGDALY